VNGAGGPSDDTASTGDTPSAGGSTGGAASTSDVAATPLQLIGVHTNTPEDQVLLLSDDAGRAFAVTVDDRLRAAVNGHLSRLGQLTMALESRISPREIQDRVRAGESAEHVAATAGVPLERVLRFVGPVLREREHVAEQARRARLAGATGPTSLLADMVARAAARRGVDADDVEWDSARREDHSWVVSVRWPDDDSAATWALDLLRHQAAPLDTAARRISGLDEPPPQAEIRPFTPRAVPALVDGDDDAPVALQLLSEHTEVVTVDVDDLSVEDFASGEYADDYPDDYGDQPAPAVSSRDADIEQLPAKEASTAAKQASAVQPPSSPAAKTRRARVPKWDDIIFGTKPKD